ncbi:MAG TPA: hypothetical protein VGH16_23545 [Candidatus Binatia bacterium]|jgi:Zn finger protein HypA/HybF involved in hydrogenase expression
MERKLWTLGCQSCHETFGVELTEEQDIIEFALRQACPHCGKKPDEVSTGRHRVVAVGPIKRADRP